MLSCTIFKATSNWCIEWNLKVTVDQRSSLKSESALDVQIVFLVIHFVMLVGIVDGLFYINYWFWLGKKDKISHQWMIQLYFASTIWILRGYHLNSTRTPRGFYLNNTRVTHGSCINSTCRNSFYVSRYSWWIDLQ